MMDFPSQTRLRKKTDGSSLNTLKRAPGAIKLLYLSPLTSTTFAGTTLIWRSTNLLCRSPSYEPFQEENSKIGLYPLSRPAPTSCLVILCTPPERLLHT